MFTKALFKFAIAIGVVCLICMLVSTTFFVIKTIEFNNLYNNELSKINDFDTSLDTSLNYIEQLEQLRETTSNDNMMAFLYSVLITVITGLGVGIVSSMNKKVIAAEEAAQRALTSASNAASAATTAAVTASESAQKNALDAARNADMAKTATDSAQKITSELELRLQSDIELMSRKQEDYASVLSVLIDVANARSALSSHRKIETTDRIKAVYDKVCGIATPFDKGVVLGLQGELLRAQTDVEDYRDYANDPSENLNDGTRQSILAVTNNWERWLNEAIRHCDVLLGQVPLAEGQPS